MSTKPHYTYRDFMAMSYDQLQALVVQNQREDGRNRIKSASDGLDPNMPIPLAVVERLLKSAIVGAFEHMRKKA